MDEHEGIALVGRRVRLEVVVEAEGVVVHAQHLECFLRALLSGLDGLAVPAYRARMHEPY